jgi:hypothetical protein
MEVKGVNGSKQKEKEVKGVKGVIEVNRSKLE